MKERKKFYLPGWCFAPLVVLYGELLLYFWTSDSPTFSRVAMIAAFALGLGGLLALIISLIPNGRAEKIVTVVVTLGLVVLYLAEYFIQDAYQVFMTFSTMLEGANGVATSFGDIVGSLLLRNLWRIGLMLLPILAYALFTKTRSASWKIRGALAAVMAASYGLALGLVNGSATDKARFTDAYHFDSAVRAFGLNMAFALDIVHAMGGGEEEFTFSTPVIPPTVATEPVSPGNTSGEEGDDPETPVVYGYNMLDLDYIALAEQSSSNTIASLHYYAAAQMPSRQNAYTGLFAGKNLIIITAEAFSAEVIDPEVTPTLYRLATQGIRFADFYQPLWGGSTSTGEFSVLTGMVAANGISSVYEACQQDLFFTMGNQLQEQGYFSAAYHNHSYTYYDRNKTHTAMGYDTFMGMGNGMEEGVADVWPESDLEMMDFTVPQYIDHQPFSVYYMTVSGHANYNNMGGNAQVTKNYPLVEHLDRPETIKYYLACNLELEKAMASLVSQLEAAGIADDTVIVLTADHYPYALEKSSTWNTDKDYTIDLYGYKYANLVERDHNALIIWSGCIEGMDLQVDSPTFSLDILPTLSNLFGLEYDSRLMVGRDVLSDQEAIVFWPDRSWRTEKGTYIFETDTFTPNPGAEVEEGYVERINTIVKDKIAFSRATQKNDYFNYVAKALAESEASQ